MSNVVVLFPRAVPTPPLPQPSAAAQAILSLLAGDGHPVDEPAVGGPGPLGAA
ncbi:hypothetical protein Sa4125_41860 [Aureimonas sp. SA4125]|uniref:hypothetical protein n=1 Tax=Aureimonas sp. SA4125 TaxID=2826993 RepID=UPI001CC70E07|nr:hypothetical protein [Aureimonas sp. SA4125]BDA86644.1 hypothetical protein Sa4125_41860 [Aureimonas sp. SA4125]